MRAYERTCSALNTFILNDFGYEDGNAAFFVFCRARRNVSVCIELRRFKFVAFKVEDGFDYFLIISVIGAFDHLCACRSFCPGGRNFDFNEVVACRRINGVIVHLNNGVALSAERFFSHIFHIFNSFVVRHNLGIYTEESGL